MSEAVVHQVPDEWARNALIDAEEYAARYRRSVDDPEGFWRDEAELTGLRRVDTRFEPGTDTASAKAGYERWQRAIEGLLETDLGQATQR